MNDPLVYFHLCTTSIDPCYLTREALDEARRTWLCPGCLEPKIGVQGVDVRLQDRTPHDRPINGVFGCSVGLIHQSLLELLDKKLVDRDLYLGRVIGDGGKELRDWLSFRGRRRVVVRGSIDVATRTCDVCGQNLYYARGKRYLCPTPPVDATIYESDLLGLIVPPAVRAAVAQKKWRKFYIEELPVLQEPLDGLAPISLS